MLIIRFQRMGKKNQALFRIVVAQKESKIKGKYIEKLGFYNPLNKEKKLNIERIKYWLEKGAQVSNSVWNLLVKEKIIEGVKRKIKIKKKKEEKSKTK